MDKVRLAMIGVSYPHARYRDLLRSIPDEVEIVAFYDPDPTTAGERLDRARAPPPVAARRTGLRRRRPAGAAPRARGGDGVPAQQRPSGDADAPGGGGSPPVCGEAGRNARGGPAGDRGRRRPERGRLLS